MSLLVCLVGALAATEFVHNAIEVWGMRQKVQWLQLSQNGQKYEPWPVNIDSLAKTWALHLAILLVVGGLSFGLLYALNIPDTLVLTGGVALLILSYLYTTWKVDLFHKEIGQLIDIKIR